MRELIEAISKLSETSMWDILSALSTPVAFIALAYQIYYDRLQKRPNYKLHIKSMVEYNNSNESFIKLTVTNLGNRPTAIYAIRAVNGKNNHLIKWANSSYLRRKLDESTYRDLGINPHEIYTYNIKDEDISVETVRGHPNIKYPVLLDIGQIHIFNIKFNGESNIDFKKTYIIVQDTLGNFYQSDYNSFKLNSIEPEGEDS